MHRTLLLVAVVVLAGCAGAGGDATPTPTPTPEIDATPTPTATPEPTPTPTPGPWESATPVDMGVIYDGQTNDTRQYFETDVNVTLVVEIDGLGPNHTARLAWGTGGSGGVELKDLPEDGTYRIDMSRLDKWGYSIASEPPYTWGYRIWVYRGSDLGQPANVTVSLKPSS